MTETAILNHEEFPKEIIPPSSIALPNRVVAEFSGLSSVPLLAL
jgi:hypothetical protein